LDAVKAESDGAAKQLSDAVASVRVPDEQALQAQRIWPRLSRRLDNANGVPQKAALARDLINNADGLTLATLREELPDYLKAAGVPTDWLPGALAARIPAAADAVTNGTKLARAHAILQRNHQALTRAIDKDTEVPPLLDPTQVNATPYTNETGL
jgi:hypothetical protein